MTIQKGRWVFSEPNPTLLPPTFAEVHKGKVVTAIALLVIASLAVVAGSLLFYYKMHTLTAWSYKTHTITAWSLLIGGGGTFVITAFTGGIALYLRKRSTNTKAVTSRTSMNALDAQPQVGGDIKYSIVSWNMATLGNYPNILYIREAMKNGLTYQEAMKALLATPNDQVLSEHTLTLKVKWERTQMFRNAFSDFGKPDILCLQGTGDMKESDLKEILRNGYTSFTYDDKDKKHDCTVVWNAAKFTKIGHAKLTSSHRLMPDTIVLLKDNANGATICVCSAHLVDSRQMRQPKGGDAQTRYLLATMEAIPANLYLFNSTREHDPARLDTLEELGYNTYLNDVEPTTYDSNLKDKNGCPMPARLDDVYSKGGKMRKAYLQRTLLSSSNRPSDHLPIAAEVSFSLPV